MTDEPDPWWDGRDHGGCDDGGLHRLPGLPVWPEGEQGQ